MRRHTAEEKRIIALAYLHRYGWIAVIMALWCVLPGEMFFYISGIGFIVFAVWTFVGYKCRWRHIYCSYQNAYRKKMTPHSMLWQRVKKSDAYGVPLIFFVLGLGLLCMKMLP